jgi:WD40-like Beta Propeller Repeat
MIAMITDRSRTLATLRHLKNPFLTESRQIATRCASLLVLAGWAVASQSEETRQSTLLHVAPDAVFNWHELVEAAKFSQPPAVWPVPERLSGRQPSPVQRDAPGATPASAPASAGTAISVPARGASKWPACAGFQRAPSLVSTFAGASQTTTRIPPDTMGAVGPDHWMSMLNDQVWIRQRATGITSSVPLATFWSALGAPQNPFDPKLLYDPTSQRWIATCCANAQNTPAPSQVFFAISASSDPEGNWARYQFAGTEPCFCSSLDSRFADFPCIGFNSKWIVITANMFCVNTGNCPPPSGGAGIRFEGSKMWVISKSSALSGGGALTVSQFPTRFDFAPTVNDWGFTLQPCATFDPNQAELYIVDSSDWFDPSDGTQLLRLSRLTGSAGNPIWSPVPSTQFGGSGAFRVTNNFGNSNSMALIGGASQAGTSALIDFGDTRACNAVFRNGRVWVSHAGGVPAGLSINRTAAFWYQIDPANMPNPIVQSGLVDSPSDFTFCPSIAVNCGDDVALALSRCSGAQLTQAGFAVRLGSDVPGTMSAFQGFKLSVAPYLEFRWGDYSASVVDPRDNRTFWLVQEVALGVTTWGTHWAELGRPLPPVPPSTSLVSIDGLGNQGNSGSFSPVISRNGLRVAFVSNSNNWNSLPDTNNKPDIYYKDLQTGVLGRASVGYGGAQANGESWAPSISDDGRYIAFASMASNLLMQPEVVASHSDVFVFDVVTGVTELISVGLGGAQANGSSCWQSVNGRTSISGDGNVIAFDSAASNLSVGGDSGGFIDVFARDRTTGITKLLSRASGATGAQGNLYSWRPSISGDGRYVGFESAAFNLLTWPPDMNGSGFDAFIRDRLFDTTTLVSLKPSNQQWATGAFSAEVSADGRYVAWEVLNPQVIAVRDLVLQQTVIASVNAGGDVGNGFHNRPCISGDGRYVGFASNSTNLVNGDNNGQIDVYVYDRQTAATRLWSLSSLGAKGNAASGVGGIAMSADGKRVVYASTASNLVANDLNNVSDIFLGQ